MKPRGNPDTAQGSSAATAQEQLRLENDSLREQLREALETLEAIRNGDVDAVVVSGTDDIARIYTLETADQTYRLLVEEMQEGALTLSKTGDILYCNARFAELVAMEAGRVMGGSLRRFVSDAAWSSVLVMINDESKGEVTIRSEREPAVPAHISFSALPAGDALPQSGSGGQEIYCCIVTDLTEQRHAEDELRAAHAAVLSQVAERERTERLLRQSQKMEAIGQLTGGIAHDFNNLLMVITGGLSILEREPPPERRKKLGEGMRQAAERGAALTRQLLAFSHQKELRPKAIAIERYIEGMRELLDGSLGGDVVVETRFEPDVWPVRVDEAELGIAILNLCVNARDAMPQGGTIVIAARNRSDLVQYALTGDFVELSVTDSGEGMDAETIGRCLEPFYTTKEIGKGSGLGLAQVYGFAHGSEGSVQIESERHRGTRVLLLLPRSDQPEDMISGQAAMPVDSATDRPSRGVLLVEDDAAVATLTREMLMELGYDVHHVPSAGAGLNALSSANRFDVILSDVMMPGMDGLSFARELRNRGVQVPIVLISGYAEAARRDAESTDIPLLAKPFGLDQLARALDGAIASPDTKVH